VTARDKLHRLVDELDEALQHWARAENAEPAQDAWALQNAREAIREDRGSPRRGPLA